MRTQILYKLLCVALLIPALSLGNNVKKGKHSLEKTITKEYKVSPNAQLKVDNSYGNINVVTWTENRVVIEVTIQTKGNDLERVQKKLDDIDVEFSASSDLVSAKTIFNKGNSKSWWKWNNNNNVNMKINYLIKLPITNSVNLDNNYGSINVGKLEGRAVISCDYGKITTKELMAEDNVLSFDYTNNCIFEYINSGKINADYSSFTLESTKNIIISADYSNSTIEVAEDVSYNCDYGNMKINIANNITGNGDYLTTRIGAVYKNVSLKADYGSIKIDRMTEKAGNLTIQSDYVGITIGYEEGYNFDFDIDLEYASLSQNGSFEFMKKRVESTDKYFSGYHGSSNSGNLIKITSDYGSVNFKQVN
ncbi:MAG: hypothetical protein BM564_02480 [Bacteroidetes bacterium MedPE-SWsnd-G2]|nr:MAG: hypothetical protein BM564_02480 [Bacteroidetes bacterium MedPE-SWsnd-G2]